MPLHVCISTALSDVCNGFLMVVQILDRTSAHLVLDRLHYVEQVSEDVQHATRHDESILNIKVALRRVELKVCGVGR